MEAEHAYGWIIDWDAWGGNEVGTTGPASITPELSAQLADGKGYVGVVDGIPDEGFGPLWDFGEPNAGATTIQYLVAGSWLTL